MVKDQILIGQVEIHKGIKIKTKTSRWFTTKGNAFKA